MEIEFRNLAGNRLEAGLAAFLEPEVAAGRRALVLCGSRERLDAVNLGLWTYDPASFLPHGAAADGYAERQPVLLSTEDANPNGAAVLALLDDADVTDPERFERCCVFFDRNDPTARDAARARWRRYQAAGRQPIYWEYKAQGWERRAG
ncbi:MAG: DNA polymerase III subunit chi [Alphaproteobacteria bacterium]